jgi:hypothetical protein
MDHSSKLEIGDPQKTEIILKLLELSTSQIMTWHSQAYVAGTASVGLILVIAKKWLSSEQRWSGLIAYEIGIIAIAVLTQLHLRAADGNYRGNEETKLKCEYVLRLTSTGTGSIGRQSRAGGT